MIKYQKFKNFIINNLKNIKDNYCFFEFMKLKSKNKKNLSSPKKTR